MKQDLYFLGDIYTKKQIHSIIELAIENKYDIYFLNCLTDLPQPLTPTQLTGLKKFDGINILLETGQTYQIGLDLPPKEKCTYQEIYLADLSVDRSIYNRLKRLIPPNLDEAE